jgi:class 3 adenylate cyclase
MSGAAGAGAPYGRLDRLLHRIAFASLETQKALGRWESRLYAAELDAAGAARPVFVTALPRAGTTVLLEALAGLPEFASATYRDMPFTLAPMLWRRFAAGFARRGGRAERAHGDGVEVGLDSPEAFEETLWLAFWPAHYAGAAIRPWPADAEAAGFADFLRSHMAKIVRLAGPPARRYLSKNNGNIARLGLIERLFPDACLVVPVREPTAQAASLLRQHRRFAALHAEDPFARAYMEGLGHFEFGAALKPIAFGDAAAAPKAAAENPDFWLGYWIEAYAAIFAQARGRVILVDHDALAADPAGHLPALGRALGVAAPEALLAAAPRFRPTAPASPLEGADPALVARAQALHAVLRRRCLRPARP